MTGAFCVILRLALSHFLTRMLAVVSEQMEQMTDENPKQSANWKHLQGGEGSCWVGGATRNCQKVSLRGGCFRNLQSSRGRVLLGEGKSVFFKGMAPGRSVTLQWVDPHPLIHGPRGVDSMGYKNKFFKGHEIRRVWGNGCRLGRS